MPEPIARQSEPVAARAAAGNDIDESSAGNVTAKVDRGFARKRCLWRLVWTATLLLLAASLCACLGPFGWPFELACHFPWQYCWLSASACVLFLLGRRYRGAMLAGLCAIWNLSQFAPVYFAPPPTQAAGPTIRALSANVFLHNREYAAVLDEVKRSDADVVLLMEVDPTWIDAVQELEAIYPYRRSVPDRGSGIALYSRLPLHNVSVESLGREFDHSIIAEFETDGRPWTLIGFHPVAPYTPAHLAVRDRQLAALARRIESLDDTQSVVVLGDLNITPYSPSFGKLLRETGLKDSRQGFGIHGSWPSALPAALRIPIDHCLVSPRVKVLRRELGAHVGSDHRPLAVEFVLP